jgi:glycosyltransferase involved in cell wall biosynthesis
MRLIFIFNSRLPTPRAHGIQVAAMSEAFAASGIETEIWLPKIPNDISEDIFSYYKIQRIFQIRQLKSLSLNNVFFPAGLIYRVRYLTFLISVLLKPKRPTDIFFTRHPEIAWCLSLLGYRVIFELHNWIAKKKKINRILLKKVFLIVATTNLIKEELIKSGFIQDKILVAPHGVELSKFMIDLPKAETRHRLGWPLDKKIIVYTGHLYDRKGVQTIIAAAKQLPSDYQIYLIGGLPSDIAKIKAATADIETILVLGSKKHEEIPFCLQAADILLIANSSQDQVESYYTAPLKLFEYLASGRPIVASDVPALREFLTPDLAVLVQPDQPVKMAKALISLAQDANRQAGYAQRGQQLARNFNWASRAQKIITAVSRIMSLDRLNVIQGIIDKIGAKNYLEIGVEYGTVFTRLEVVKKVAVDPNLKVSWARKLIDGWCGRQAKYFSLPSDEFFAGYASLFEKEKIDVAFIDGLHTFEQSLRDVENCLKFLSPCGVIVLHDCNPQSAPAASPQRPAASETRKWNGDVWKTIVYLRSQRKDLNIFVLDCDQGLGIIVKGEPENTLSYSKDEIVKMDYSFLENNREELLNLKNKDYFEEFLKTWKQ